MRSARVLRIFSRGAPGRPFHGASGVYSYYYLAPWTHGPTFLWDRGSVNMPPKKDNRAPAALAWVFTHQADCQDLQDTDTLLAEGEELVGRIIDCCQIYAFQLEVAPTTGQLHWQGYMELLNKKRLTAIKKDIFPFHYLAKRAPNATPLQAFNYASKPETRVLGPWLCGMPSNAPSGAQKRLELFVKDVKAGFNDQILLDHHPAAYCQYPRVIDRIRSLSVPVRQVPLEVYVFYGPPGTGKTQFARDQAFALGVHPYEVPIGNGFWLTPRADRTPYCIIDEFKSNLALKDLLRLLDKYPIEVPIKGGFVWWCPDIIVITTNINPWSWYRYNDRDFEREALFRRFTGVYGFAHNPSGTPLPQPLDLHSIKPDLSARDNTMADFNLFMKGCKEYFIGTYHAQ